MLKKNLIAIAIISLAMVLTSNAFGQWNPDIDKIKAGNKPVAKKTTEIQSVKSPRDVSTGQSSGKSKQKPTTSYEGATYAGNFSFNAFKGGAKNRQKTNGYIGETEKNLKTKPRAARAQDKMGNFEIQRRQTRKTGK